MQLLTQTTPSSRTITAISAGLLLCIAVIVLTAIYFRPVLAEFLQDIISPRSGVSIGFAIAVLSLLLQRNPVDAKRPAKVQRRRVAFARLLAAALIALGALSLLQ